jgi:alcohol dehydrogenase class IV
MLRDRRLARMAHAMGLDARSGADDSGEAVAEAIRRLNARLGLPSGLAELGVTPIHFDKIIDGAMADHCHKTNPRLATRADYVAMLETSM